MWLMVWKHWVYKCPEAYVLVWGIERDVIPVISRCKK